MGKKTRRETEREAREWDLKVGQRVNSKLNAMPNKYHARKEVGVPGGEHFFFIWLGDRDAGMIGIVQGTLKALSREGEDGRSEHSGKQHNQHQKSRERKHTVFVYTRTMECLGLGLLGREYIE